MNALFEFIRYATFAYNFLHFYAGLFFGTIFTLPSTDTHRSYFLSDDHEWDSSYTRVPEHAVYIEEWLNVKGEKKCRIRYEGDEIPRPRNPWIEKPVKPWIWVGDTETEIDLTKTFDKFLVVGNHIELALVLKLIHITETTNLMYIHATTLKEEKFPGEGILIEADAS